MWCRLLAVGIPVALAIAGCGGGDEEKGGGGQGAQNFQVQLALKTDEFNLSALAYFPKDLTVHPGDTVTFIRPTFDGEPHTITLGTLVDAGVRKLDQLGPRALPVQQEEVLRKLPDVFPHRASTLSISPVINRSASQPCFVASGQPPGDEAGARTNPAWLAGGVSACKNQTLPPFDGKSAYYNLGLNNEKGSKQTLRISKSIKPGTYRLLCLVHRGAMRGKITVVRASQKIPTPAQQDARGQRESQQAIAALRPVAAQAKKATASQALAGFGNPQNLSAVIAEFAPKTLTVKRGTTVTWKMFLFHTMSLNSPEDAIGALVKDPQGNWEFNPKASVGVPTKLPRPPAVTLSGEPPVTAKPVVYDGGSFDGRGYQSTGVFGSLPPAFVTFKLRFTQPGSFTLRCALHPDMKAKVNVI